MSLSAEHLRELMNYEPETGVFRWRVARSNRVKVGAIAGAVNKCTGYVDIRIVVDATKQHYSGHRLAWFWMTGKWPPLPIDHIDCNRSNNAWKNLRCATKGQNAVNTDKPRPSRSGLRGVFPSRNGGRWVSKIEVSGKQIYLGTFDTRADAREAYYQALLTHFGEFAKL